MREAVIVDAVRAAPADASLVQVALDGSIRPATPGEVPAGRA